MTMNQVAAQLLKVGTVEQIMKALEELKKATSAKGDLVKHSR